MLDWKSTGLPAFRFHVWEYNVKANLEGLPVEIDISIPNYKGIRTKEWDMSDVRRGLGGPLRRAWFTSVITTQKENKATVLAINRTKVIWGDRLKKQWTKD